MTYLWLKNAVLNNGRVVMADVLITATTSVDLIEAVRDLYKAKTTLKGIPEKAVEYLLKKRMLNSMYGMMVTDII